MLAIQDVRVYADPEASAIERCSVLIDRGRIVRVGPDVSIPPDARVLTPAGGTVVAGFWNLHVHLTEPFWSAAVRAGPDDVNRRLTAMLASRGFTTALDLGSDPRISLPLRDGLSSGKYRGPRLFTAGTPVYPPRGVPYYVKASLPPAPRWLAVHWILPQPKTSRSAIRAVRRSLDRGCDVVKLFTGSYVARGQVEPMPEGIARAAVDAAHAQGRLVFAHPSNAAGTRVAVVSGVDVLAHAPDTPEGIDDPLLRRMVERGMSMIPTLKMFATTITSERSYLDPIYELVRRFRRAGGRLLFGTDVGFMTDYSTDAEFVALEATGASWREILGMLTTGPSLRMGTLGDRGRVSAGQIADLVVLDGDPGHDIGAFSRVRTTIRDGAVIWDRSTNGD